MTRKIEWFHNFIHQKKGMLLTIDIDVIIDYFAFKIQINHFYDNMCLSFCKSRRMSQF